MREQQWCACCDTHQVDSAEPESGRFYAPFGHVLDQKGEWDGDYVPVLFAVCCYCTIEELMEKHRMCFKTEAGRLSRCAV